MCSHPYDMTLIRRMGWGTPMVWHLRTGRAEMRSGTRSSPYHPVCLTYIFRFPNPAQSCQPGNLTECNRTPTFKTEYTMTENTMSRHNHRYYTNGRNFHHMLMSVSAAAAELQRSEYHVRAYLFCYADTMGLLSVQDIIPQLLSMHSNGWGCNW